MPVTAEQVLQDLRNLNVKEVAPLPKNLMKSGKPLYIFNVSPKRWIQCLGSLGTWTIHPCEDGQEYSKATEVPFVVPEGIPTDMKKIEHRLWEGAEVAKDIVGVGPYKRKDCDLTRWGVFISNSNPPDKSEVKAAKKAYHERLVELVREGDEFNAQGPLEVKNISADMRMACRVLNIERPWAQDTQPMTKCPGCGYSVNSDAAVHAGQFGCGAVINEEKVIAIRLKGYEHIWQKQSVKQ